MARIRTVKPDFFRHEKLYEAEKVSGLPLRIAFAGLWTASDREGRFRWAPRALKLDCLPYDDVDFALVLEGLRSHGFIVKYQTDKGEFGFIPSWHEHQHINQREAKSSLPVPSEECICKDGASTCTHIPARGEGKGREGEGKEKDAAPDGAHSDPPSDESELFRRGKDLLGPNAGGLIANLLKAKGGSIPLARAAIETAATKQDGREYIGAIIRGKDPPDDARARGDAW